MLNVNKMLKTKYSKGKKIQKTLTYNFISLFIFFPFLRPKSGYFPNQIIEFSTLWLLHRLLEMKCVQKKREFFAGFADASPVFTFSKGCFQCS